VFSGLKFIIKHSNISAIKVYQLLVDGRWFSPAFSTTKTGRHDIAEILLCLMINFKPENT
jgi:hypothetical protein